MSKVISSREFGYAVCRHFAIPTDQVSNVIEASTEVSGMMSVKITVFLKPADLIGIGEKARERLEG